MNYLQGISTIVLVNGMYDILCALAILKCIHVPILDKLHLSMFKPKYSNLHMHKQQLAYYILGNGLIRTIGGLYMHNPTLVILVLGSYILEAVIVLYETFVKQTIILENGLFVSITSLILFRLIYYQFVNVPI